MPFDRRVWQESTALRDAGWEVHVVCPRGTRRDTEPHVLLDGVRIHRYPLRAATGGPLGYVREYGAALWHTARLARRVGPVDVVHACNPPDLLFLVAVLLRRRGARFVFDQHDLVPELYLSRFGRGEDLLYRAVLLLERLTYRAADVVVATNESYREVALARGGKRPGDVFVVRSAPAVERFHLVPAEEPLKRGKPYLLCYLGVMGPQDGVDYALRALAALRDGLGRTDWHAVFVGAGDAFDDAVALARELDLSGCVEFTGRIPDEDLLRYLSTADVCLAPDPLNPLNDVSTMNKIMEYMAMARPVVSFDLREARVSAGEAAVYAPANDEAAFAKLVARLLDDPAERRRMGEIGRARVSGPLSWDHSRAALLAAYEAAVAQPVRRPGRARAWLPDVARRGRGEQQATRALGGIPGVARRALGGLRRGAGRLLFERRYGVRTADFVRLEELGLAHRDRVYYSPANWHTLRRTLPLRDVGEHDVFIDLGSGMGRMVLEAASRYPFRRVIGVELSERLNDIARANVAGTRLRLRCRDIDLVRSDVLDYEIPDDVSVVFLNNPFRGDVFAEVVGRLVASVDRNPRPVTVIYFNPVEEAFLLSTGRFRHLRTVRRGRGRREDGPFGSTRVYAITAPSGA